MGFDRLTSSPARTIGFSSFCLLLLACAGPHVPAAHRSVPVGGRASEPAERALPAAADEPATPNQASTPASIRLSAPPLEAQPAEAPGVEGDSFVAARLVEIDRRKNQITDVDAWFAKHELETLARELNQARRMELVALGAPAVVEGMEASRELVHQDHLIVLYDAPEQRGRYLVVLRAGAVVGPFDFEAYREPPQGEGEFTAMETRWAQVFGNTLLVSHAHRTYAQSSGGHNAYVSALSLPDGTLRWRSPPLVANAEECVLVEGNLVCGYGFTAEPDFLYILDARTGRVRQQYKLTSGPEHIRLRDNLVFVRAYNTDYIFELRRE